MSARSFCLAWFLLVFPAIAHAQAGATITITSDERFRGRSVSRGDPALTLSLSYDHPSGIYLNAAAATAIVESEPEVINVQANIGFIRRTAGGAGLDIGVIRSNYSKYSSGERSSGYTEIYAGVVTRKLAIHFHYSPDYFQSGVQTVYAEIDGVVEPASDWRLTAHAGTLVRVAGPAPPGSGRFGYDWQIAAARGLGPIELQLAVSDGGPMPEYYDDREHDRLAVTFSLVWSL
jgi:uncharacterized protein (TIGR02001 family)